MSTDYPYGYCGCGIGSCRSCYPYYGVKLNQLAEVDRVSAGTYLVGNDGNTYSVDAIRQFIVPSLSGFSATQVTGDSNTGVGLVNRYEYTEITAPVTFTILDADRESGTVINPWNFEIKDKSGDCDGTNTISIVREDGQPIEGANPLIINVSFGGVALYSDGTDIYTQGGTV